jgi:hypothetical protein
MSIILTQEERDILNHVVKDADNWAANPKVTREMVDAKVAKYRADYEANSALPDYKTRADRDAVIVVVPTTTDMIKAEAGKRILVRYPQWKQANMTARMVELNKIRASVGSWTAGEQIEVDVIQSAWDWVKSVRSASDALELTLPVDYNNNNNLYWPES